MHVTAAAVIHGPPGFVRSTSVRIRSDAAAIDGKPLQILTWERSVPKGSTLPMSRFAYREE